MRQRTFIFTEGRQIVSKRIFSAGLMVLALLVLSACQPLLLESAAEMAQSEAALSGNFDFTLPDWGLKHGWVQFDVSLPDEETQLPEGWIRWVEVNGELDVRYVIAEPKCVSFGADGQTALMAVQISDRYGWGEGDPGQWMTFWFDGIANEFASPLWPPSDEDPGCTYEEPPYRNAIVAGDIAIR